MAVLGVLKDRAMHGYELKKELSAQLGQFWQFSYGSLYPTIKRLEKSGAVERVYDKQNVKRRLNIYRITPVGEKLFDGMIAEHSEVDDARFSIKMAFFRYMESNERVELLERRRAYLTDKLIDLRAKLRAYKERLDAYTYRLMEHGVDTTSADLEWVDRLIAEEKSETPGPAGTVPGPAGG
ncbi:MAG: PadR family transcriptional regulator [Actinomycetota bacterium]